MGGGTRRLWTQCSKAFTTGGQFVVDFANQLVWQFSGQQQLYADTVLDFSLIQPLLRDAGRDRIMEQLTLVERDAALQRADHGAIPPEFYVDTAVGGGTNGSTPTRGGSGGALGQGLSGFSGVGATGFGNVSITGGGGGTNAGSAGRSEHSSASCSSSGSFATRKMPFAAIGATLAIATLVEEQPTRRRGTTI